MDSFSDDSAYVIENLPADTEPTNSASPADDTTGTTTVDEETNQAPQSPHLVAINIPFGDSGVPTIIEDQDSVLVIENPLLKAPVCDAQDDKQPTTQENESCVTTTSEEIVKANRQIENLCTNASTNSPSSGVSSDGTLKLPAASQDMAPRSSYMVAISIPCDDSSIPMLAEDKVNCDPCASGSSNEVVKMQRNPAYDVIDDKRTTANRDETVKIQRNPAYDVIDDKCTTANRDEIVRIQRNPAYTAINCASSEVYSYVVIPYATVSTTSANNTATTSMIMQKNPAYTTYTVNNYCRSTQQNS